MQRKCFLLLPCLALTACVMGPSRQSQMAAYVGADVKSLVQSLGVPDKHITVNNVQYLAYVNTTNYGPQGYYGGFYYPSYPALASCETTFTVKDARVLSVKLQGDACN